MKFVKQYWKLLTLIIIVTAVILLLSIKQTYQVTLNTALWQIKSVDTMKYSRDLARQKISDVSFSKVIDTQMADIASTGATHVAIDTPYDEEFYPILARWVEAARRHKLHIWFRGNMSGWEGWFEYPKIDRATHTKKISEFIFNHRELFADGDIFSSCPECENGGSGDPRAKGDVVEYRKFLINEYQATKQAFSGIHKNVASNYFSMNYDVATLVMDKPTTKALDGVVVIDHYVRNSSQYVSDIDTLAEKSGGKVMIGEFGAPIPDLNGKMTEDQQAEWINDALNSMVESRNVIGINYWTNVGSSTELWNSSDMKERKVVSILKEFYTYKPAYGMVQDETGEPIGNVSLKKTRGTTKSHTAADGTFILTYLKEPMSYDFKKLGYKSKRMTVENQGGPYIVTLEKENPPLLYMIKRIFK